MNKSENKIPIWLDCDPGLDDTLAIIYASHNDGIQIVGLSTSPGNTTLPNTTRNALDVLYNIGRSDVPVFPGSNIQVQGVAKTAEIVHGENGLGGVQVKQSPKEYSRQDNFAAIYNRIMTYQTPIVWVNTGSLTNLALLMMAFPSIKTKIERIVMMGGAIERGNITPAAQFNIHCDPAAFQRVLQVKGGVPLVMIPLETTHQFPANQKVYNQIKSYEDHPFGKALYTMALHYQQFYKQVENKDFPPYHDPVTIHYLLYPQDFQVKEVSIQVDCFQKSYGRTNVIFKQEGDGKTLTTMNLKGELSKFWVQILNSIKLVFSQQIQAQVK